jgi:putative aldouronate transport system permease protein
VKRKKINIWQILINAGMLVILVVTIYPFLYILANSVSDPIRTIRSEVFLIPKGFQLNTYRLLLQSSSLTTSYYNTIWYTVIGTLISTLVVIFAAYPLSQKNFFIRRPISTVLLLTMYFSGGMVPLFVTINRLGLYNTRWAIILPVAANVYYIIITRTYFDGIPESLIESAKLDGANDFQIFIKIILGISGPIIAVIILFNAVGYWNTYFNALLYLPSTNLHPLQVFLNKLLVQQLTNTGASGAAGQMSMERSLNVHQFKYAAIIITVLPIVFVYPLVQKHFIKGVMIGAVKS